MELTPAITALSERLKGRYPLNAYFSLLIGEVHEELRIPDNQRKLPRKTLKALKALKRSGRAELLLSIYAALNLVRGRVTVMESPGSEEEAAGLIVTIQYSPDLPASTTLLLQEIMEAVQQKAEKAPENRLIPIRLNIQRSGCNLTPFLTSLNWLCNMYPNMKITVSVSEVPEPADNRKEKVPGRFRKEAARQYRHLCLAPEKKLSHDPGALGAFRQAVRFAENEVPKNPKLCAGCFDFRITPELWEGMGPKERFAAALTLGRYGALKRTIFTVDFVPLIPYCEALALYFWAQEMPKENRRMVIDVGNREDPAPLDEALKVISLCDADWHYSLLSCDL